MKRELRNVLTMLIEETKNGTNNAAKHEELFKSIKKQSVKSEIVFSDEGTDYKGDVTKEEIHELVVEVGGGVLPVRVGLFKSKGSLEGDGSEIYLVQPSTNFGELDWFRSEISSVDELLVDDMKAEGVNRHYNNTHKDAFKKEKKKNTLNFKSFLDNEPFACRECGELLVSEEEKEQQRHHACKSAWIDRQNKEFEKRQLTIFDL